MPTAALLLVALLGAFAPAEAHPRIVRALELPVQARALRHAGALEVDLQIALSSARHHHLPPADVVVVFGQYVALVPVAGPPVQGFGPFLAARWDDGLRGRALASAIKRTHGHGPPGHGPYDAKHGGKHLDAGPGWAGRGNGHSASASAGKSKGKAYGGGGKGRKNDHGKGK